MQLILTYNKQGSVVGYVLTAETDQDSEVLKDMRNMHFFAPKNNPVLYDGVNMSTEKPEQISEMSFITKDAMKIRDAEISERESLKTQTFHAESKLLGLGLKQVGDGLFSLADPSLLDVQVQVVQKKRPYRKRISGKVMEV